MSVPILVTAFCRPELTIQALTSLIALRPKSEIIVSQDGKIPGFYEIAHVNTRNALLQFAKKHPQIRLNLRDVNQGLTQHLFDVFESLFQSHSCVIFLEEDMRICETGVTFLEASEQDLGISHRTAFSTTGHPQGLNSVGYRLSYFPEQWGISINYNTFQAFKEEYRKKQIDRSSVRRVIKQVKFGKVKGEFLTDFWTDLLRKEINSPHGWDAMLQWTLWKNLAPSRVSFENHVIDLGGQAGAITTRENVESALSYSKLKHSESSEVFCLNCEQQDAARRKFSSLSQLRSRTQIRTRMKALNEMRTYR